MAKPAPMLGPVPMRLPPQLSRNISGVQLGVLLGWMSTRVLGQYDQLLIEDEAPDDQDIVYYVGHNVIELEDRYGFQPHQFRLWIALHEVTHRAQFTGVPWLRPYFLDLVRTLLEGVEPDPRRLIEALKRAAAEAREGKNPLDEGGLMALLASPEQRQALDRIGGFMSLLEGHGDVVMNRAAKGRIPQAQRFAHVLQQRRQRTRSGQSGELPGRPRCQAQAVRAGRTVHRSGGEGGRSGAFRPGLAGSRVVTQHGRDPRAIPLGRASPGARPYGLTRLAVVTPGERGRRDYAPKKSTQSCSLLPPLLPANILRAIRPPPFTERGGSRNPR